MIFNLMILNVLLCLCISFGIYFNVMYNSLFLIILNYRGKLLVKEIDNKNIYLKELIEY